MAIEVDHPPTSNVGEKIGQFHPRSSASTMPHRSPVVPGVPTFPAGKDAVPTSKIKDMKANQAEQEKQGWEEGGRNCIDDSAAAEAQAGSRVLYELYNPAKLDEGVAHPDPTVETASLAGVEPPDITYTHHLQKQVCQSTLSSLQLESIIYAMQKFNGPKLSTGERQGYFLGDGAGVGKGRQIAGLIAEHWRTGGTRALWVSVSADLKFDAARDLEDLGLDLALWPSGTKPLPGGKLDSKKNGIDDGVLFCTYSLLVSRSGSAVRLQQIVNWLKGDTSERPLIVLDECHKAKNLLPKKGKCSATAVKVVELQQLLPNAQVLYCSATGASEPENLSYMTRLGTWGFDNFDNFLKTIKSAGMGAMEMFAMGLKATGAYSCRTLSYAGAEFEVSTTLITPALDLQYKRAALFWQLLLRILKILDDHGVKIGRQGWCAFWSSHLRFFKQMLISAKVPTLSEMAKDAVENKNMCVVIGLQSTGEAALNQQKEDDGDESDEFVSAPKMILQRLIQALFPSTRESLDDEALCRLELRVRECVTAWNSINPDEFHVLLNNESQEAHNHDSSLGQDDEDDIQVVAAMSCDEVEAAKLAKARLNGDYIDLDVTPTQEDLAEMDKVILEEEQEEARKQEEARRKKIEEGKRRLEAEALEQEAEKKGQQLLLKIKKSKATTGAKATMKPAKPVWEGQGCRVCGIDSDDCLLCDSCDSPYHSLCLVPPLAQVPEGDWFCPECVERRTGHGTVASPFCLSDEEDAAASAEDLEDSEYASSCTEASSSDDERDMEFDPTGGDCNDDMEVEVLSCARPARRIQIKRKSGPCRKRSTLENPLSTEAGEELGSQPKLRKMAHGNMPEDRTKKPFFGPSVKAEIKCKPPLCRSTRSMGPTDLVNGIDSDFEDEDHAESDGPDGVRCQRLVRMKALLLKVVDSLLLPPNPLDHLKGLLGGEKEVAEMTGRQEEMVRRSDGSIAIQRRCGNVPLKMVNMAERDAFMSGRKHIAIISEAASCGISLQADRRVKNQRRRLHITLELPWSADRAIQQFGRSHRANQVSAPIYRILVAPCGGERRFASSAAKRLQSLGALLSGDRRALGAGVELKEFDIDNKYGHEALGDMYNDILHSYSMSGVNPPRLPDGQNFYRHAEELLLAVGLAERDKFRIRMKQEDKSRVDRFLNRLLGLPIQDQEVMFKFFSDMFDHTVAKYKSEGKYDDGIVSLTAESIEMMKGYPKCIHTDPGSSAKTYVAKLEVDRGLSWERAVEKWESYQQEDWASNAEENGFWVSTFNTNIGGTGKPIICLATEICTDRSAYRQAGRVFRIQRPNNSTPQAKKESELRMAYRKVSQKEAEAVWRFWYNHTITDCMHGRECKTRKAGHACFFGMRLEQHTLVTGAVLPVWRDLCDIIARIGRDKRVLRVVRAELNAGNRVVGLQVNQREMNYLVDLLQEKKSEAIT